jgi:murein DD-endopeptidase MepM/ murein hydrolase activator NlpD
MLSRQKSKLKKRRSFTIILIPHNQKAPRQLKIPKFLVALVALSLTLAAVGMVSFALDYKEVALELDRLRHVDEVNCVQQGKICELAEKARLMEAKIAELNKLDKQVRELVGLEVEEEEDLGYASLSQAVDLTDAQRQGTFLSFTLASRGGVDRSREPDLLEDLDQDFAYLDGVAKQQQETLELLQEEVTEQVKLLAAKPDFWPVSGRITSKFGYRRSPFGTGRREYHDGLDIAAPYGTAIRAAGDGTVTFAGYVAGYGRMLTISHGYGYLSHYAHNSVNLVKVGDAVKKGERVAKVGTSGRTTGAHVHFMIDLNGKRIDPLNVLR